MRLRVDSVDVDVVGDGTLLDVLRDELGIRSVKDGCSPQGQCGCCTVWVDGAARVACVTPARRAVGREVTTLDGLPDVVRRRWASALVATGGSQCGFCTPGIVMRLAALAARTGTGGEGAGVPDDKMGQALLAHLCRCTGWQTIEEAARLATAPSATTGADDGDRTARDLDLAARRAAVEGRVAQRVGPDVVLGRAGFADDTSPAGALVAVPDSTAGHALGNSVRAAREASGKVQGRSTSLAPSPPVDLPPGRWALSLRTNWVEPGYVEPDASWCAPGGTPASPFGNGGAFGGKLCSPAPADARWLADELGRPVRVLWSREDVVRRGPKRPPVAGGLRADGSGTLRVGVSTAAADDPAGWERVVAAVGAVAPSLVPEQVEVTGPPTSFDLRAAVWAEAAVLARCAPFAGRPDAVVDQPVEVVAPEGGRAVVTCTPGGALDVAVWAGEVLDDVVLRSYCIGAAHQALSWVRSEAVAVDAAGAVHDLTVRSFGIVPARAMPPVRVTVRPGNGPPVNGSDAVFAAAAAAVWLADGLGGVWPTGTPVAGGRGPAGGTPARPRRDVPAGAVGIGDNTPAVPPLDPSNPGVP